MSSLRKLALAYGRNDDRKVLWSNKKEDYDALSTIGRGGCAEVVLAKCLMNRKLCAIKQIDLSGSCAIDRTLREIRLMAKLKHSHIIGLNAAFAHENEIWIVEDFFPLGSLEDVMDRGSRVTGSILSFGEKAIATILKDVLGALEYLHGHGFVHNDIKPGNIFLKNDGNSILADLGGARRVSDRGPGLITTEAYRAPEITRRSMKSSYESDVWSVGITALVLYGEDMAGLTRVERVRVVMEMNIQPEISVHFRQFLTSALNIDPACRASTSVLRELKFLESEVDKQSIADVATSHLSYSRSNTTEMPKQEEIMDIVLTRLMSKKLNRSC